MNLDYFIVYKEEEHNFKEKIGLFIGSEDNLKNLISKLISDAKSILFQELEIYQNYKIHIKQFISDNFKIGIRNSELVKIVLEESYVWLKKFDKLACNLHLNPNSGKIIMETIHWSWSSIIPRYTYEKIQVIHE